MSEKADPIVSIELGGKKRYLKYCFRTMVAFTKATGKNLFEPDVTKQILEDTTPIDLLTMIWAMLLHEEKDLTIEQVEEWITLENQAECARRVIEAWAAAMPKGGKKEKPPLPGKSRTGSKSGR